MVQVSQEVINNIKGPYISIFILTLWTLFFLQSWLVGTNYSADLWQNCTGGAGNTWNCLNASSSGKSSGVELRKVISKASLRFFLVVWDYFRIMQK